MFGLVFATLVVAAEPEPIPGYQTKTLEGWTLHLRNELLEQEQDQAALKETVTHMRQAPDTHRSGRIVLVGGATVTHRFGADLGNLDLRSAARTGPGYHDKAWERGTDCFSAKLIDRVRNT